MWMIFVVAAGVDPDRVELLQLVADGDDHVRAVEAEVDVVAAHEPDGAQRQRVVVGEDALAVEGRGDRDAERLGEAAQGRGRAPARAAPCPASTIGCAGLAQDAAARSTCPREGSSGRGTFTAQRLRPVGCRRLLDVLGDGQVDGAGPLGLGELERLADHLRHRARRRHQRGPLGHRREHRDQVHALVGLLEAAVHADLGRQRDHRRRVGRRVGRARAAG